MKIKKTKQKILYLGIILTCIFILLFIATCIHIGTTVKNQCQNAQDEYNKNCVESLISLLNDRNKSFNERNSAIWALGQLGNKNTLPMLKKYYTGNVPTREPLGKTISQYELKKAINLVSGGFNISAIIWRIGFVEK